MQPSREAHKMPVMDANENGSREQPSAGAHRDADLRHKLSPPDWWRLARLHVIIPKIQCLLQNITVKKHYQSLVKHCHRHVCASLQLLGLVDSESAHQHVDLTPGLIE